MIFQAGHLFCQVRFFQAFLTGYLNRSAEEASVDERPIYTASDVLGMLDGLLERREGEWWDEFFANREKPCPFFVEWPDESLVEYIEAGDLVVGRVLELGCGHGRNALYLARQGCQVDAVDFSQKAIVWARERAELAGLAVNFMCRSMFDLPRPEKPYDIVYDCGCYHHLPPHRRESYVKLVTRSLVPEGMFALVCFTPKGGSSLSDLQVYEQRTLQGGLAYTEDQLRYIFERAFRIEKFRRMREMPPESKLFGKAFCWSMLMKALPNQPDAGDG
jgi:SAM-dependent methyltransferase